MTIKESVSLGTRFTSISRDEREPRRRVRESRRAPDRADKV